MNDVKTAWEKEGLKYIIKNSPEYVKRKTKRGAVDVYNPYGVIDRERLKSICSAEDKIWYYGSRTEFEISPPLNGRVPEKMRGHIGTHRVDPSFVCELSGARLIGDRALSRTSDGKYILEEMGTEPMLKNRLLEAFDSLTPQEKLREITWPVIGGHEADTDYDVLINLVPRHGGSHNNYINFGHWLLEDLPRLRACQHYYDKTGRKPLILLKKDPPSWAIDTLRLLGFSSSDWIEWDKRSATVSRLVVPKLNYVHSHEKQYQPSDRKWVGEQMKSRIDLDKNEFCRRVFVSRQGQERRKIINFDEVSDTVRNFGFEIFRPEELTTEDQIRLFDQAEVVLGPTGSAFANVIFADSATIIPILPRGWPLDTRLLPWHIIASEQDLEYDYLIGDSLDDKNNNKNSDIYINTSELMTVLQDIL
ncbi:glycosyltransferase family 61 protein [Haladaptatus sp. F3-133]|uniref:Glycosyltransferase family 61 protein n=1 Tax=Halorutilus salinus TaxID=2487751 RepID=A0A9Q4C458_9EURY|nr:glycosyltransferase family 61 protein [Halorutilus salinus]